VFNNPEAGFNYAAEFQSAGLPWVTSSTGTTTPQRWSFPKISRSITIKNTSTGSTNLSVGFTQNGVLGSNNFVVSPNTLMVFETRVTELWIVASGGTAGYSIFAALTSVPARNMPILTGSVNSTIMWDGVG
jgi:hypothetical protein